jgi:hypothetical protein
MMSNYKSYHYGISIHQSSITVPIRKRAIVIRITHLSSRSKLTMNFVFSCSTKWFIIYILTLSFIQLFLVLGSFPSRFHLHALAQFPSDKNLIEASIIFSVCWYEYVRHIDSSITKKPFLANKPLLYNV